MSDLVTAGDIAAVFLERCGVDHAFGVISIHNMPVLDGVFRRNKINFVPARSEGGAVNMADANARVRGGLGVADLAQRTFAALALGLGDLAPYQNAQNAAIQNNHHHEPPLVTLNNRLTDLPSMKSGLVKVEDSKGFLVIDSLKKNLF